MKVFVIRGKWRQEIITNLEFDLVSSGIMNGRLGLYVTVKGAPLNANSENIRIYIKSEKDVTISGQITHVDETSSEDVQELDIVAPIDGGFNGETEEDTINRLNERFAVLAEMTEAAANGDIRGMLVSGAAGVGKSWTVENSLMEIGWGHRAAKDDLFEIVRGNITPIGLYKKLYEFRKENSVLVFDDSDSIFFDPISLGLLKVALDTSHIRTIGWFSESYALKDEDIPNKFEFKGAIIFITNMDLEKTKSKQLKPHFEALISRSHYLDLTIKTQRDKFLRIKGLIKEGKILDNYQFDDRQKEEVLDYLKSRVGSLRELSLRTVLKVSDLKKSKPTRWKSICDITVCK